VWTTRARGRRSVAPVALALVLVTVAGGAGAETPFIAAVVPHPELTRRALVPEMRDGRTVSGRSRQRILHFTFDDGPNVDTTPALLDHLDEAGIKATFFMVGRQLDWERGPRTAQVGLAREIARRGHTIGLHGYDHSRLTDIGEAEIVEQLDRGEAAFRRTFGARPWLFRPPYGHHDDKSDGILVGRGYTQVLWSVMGEGRRVRTPERTVDHFRTTLEEREASSLPGGIVIMHDSKSWVVTAFPGIVEAIDARNCALAARGPDEELWDVVSDIRVFFVARQADDHVSATAGRIAIPSDEHAARQARLRRRAATRCTTADAGVEEAW
jgi:peptidoglycan/xylan/chitin deacetylase (PgdA/CDA1 family)